MGNSYFPCVGKLAVAMVVIKHRASIFTQEWGDEATDTLLIHMVEKTLMRVRQDNPTHREWCADRKKLNTWVDMSSLAVSLLQEEDRTILEHAYWLHPINNAVHMPEFSAMLKCVNLVLHLWMDSLCVFYWMSDTLTGKVRRQLMRH